MKKVKIYLVLAMMSAAGYAQSVVGKWVTFLFALLPIVTSAEIVEINGVCYNLMTDKKSAEVTYKSNFGEYYGAVEIPATIEHEGIIYDVTRIGDKAFIWCSNLTSISIPNSVTNIGMEAFSGCSSLTSVTIPNSVTTISNYAFSWCSGLFTISMPESITTIGGSAFQGCTGLTSVTIPNSVLSIGMYAFSECINLASVSFGNNVSYIGESAFSRCSSLTSITIPNSVTTIDLLAFEGCSSLTLINIGTGVSFIGEGALSNCTNLTSIKVENGNPNYDSRDDCNAIIETSSNTLIFGCKKTTIPNSIMSIGKSAFWCCKDLSSITIPNSVTTIEWGAFYGCKDLASISIPNSVTTIGGNAFYETAWYNNQSEGLIYAGKVAYKYKGEMPTNYYINIEDGTLGIAEGAFNEYYNLSSITIPNSVISIGKRAFYNSGLTSIEIPNSVKSIGESAFYGCSISSFIIPSSVTYIGEGVLSCTNLTSIKVENGNPIYDSRDDCNAIIETSSNTLIAGCKKTIIPNSVNSIGDSAFYRCSNLTSLSIPNSVKSIGNSAFEFCIDLTTLAIPDGITTIGNGAFAYCLSLASITIPSSVTFIGESAFSRTSWYDNQPDGIVYVGKFVYCYKGERFANTDITIKDGTIGIAGYAFMNFSEMTSVTFPSSLKYIGNGSFSGCSGLKYLNIPNSVNIIGERAFQNCTGLTSVTIPDGVTTIGTGAFYSCRGLTTITIPNSVTSIEKQAFDYTDIQSVYSFIDEPFEITGKGSDNRTFPLKSFINARLHVPVGTIEKYKETMGWNDFEFIEEDNASNIIKHVKKNMPTTKNFYYTVDGRRIREAQRGLNIIRMSDGTTQKVMMK